MTSPLLNKIISGYKLIEHLGSGGMGEVYKAVHLQLGRVAAIKILHQTGMTNRFLNEAKVQADLKHKNIVSLYEFSEYNGKPCIIMEYVEGNDLDKIIQRKGRLENKEATDIFNQLVNAVFYLHKNNIVHRDLKPGNIKILTNGTVKLMDFGIAKGSFTPKLTQVGFAVGTIEYMSPEQLLGKPGKHSDIWSLGIILYEMMVGYTPFYSKDIGVVNENILKVKYTSISKLNIISTKSIDKIIKKCLKKNTNKRISSSELLLLCNSMSKDEKSKVYSKISLANLPINSKKVKEFVNPDFLNIKMKVFLAFIIAIIVVLVFLKISGTNEKTIVNNKKPKTETPVNPDNYTSIKINVINVPDAEIILQDGKQYKAPYTLKKNENMDATFILKAPGYKDKKVKLSNNSVRKSYDYVLEKKR